MIDKAILRQLADLLDNRPDDAYDEEGAPTQELNELVAHVRKAAEDEQTTVNTVNVIEFDGDTIMGLASYPDTPEGNKEAEERFKSVARENGVAESDLEGSLEDGVADIDDSWRVVIYHSTVV